MKPITTHKSILFLIVLACSFIACTSERKQSDYGEYYNTEIANSTPVLNLDSANLKVSDTLLTVADSTRNM